MGSGYPTNPTTTRAVAVITCAGTGVVSHVLAELADRIGLTAALSEATDSLRERRAGHDPGRVLVVAAVAITDGAVTIIDVQTLADQRGLQGPAGSVASTPDDLAGARRGREHPWGARGDPAGPRAGPGPGLVGPRGAERHRVARLRGRRQDQLQIVIDLKRPSLRPTHLGLATTPSASGSTTPVLPDSWRSAPIVIRADGAGYSHAPIACRRGTRTSTMSGSSSPYRRRPLLALAQSMLPTSEPDSHRAEPKHLRYRLMHTAARTTRGQRKLFLRLAEHWPWALALAKAFARLRFPAPPPTSRETPDTAPALTAARSPKL